MDVNKLLKPEEVAKLLGVSKQTVYTWVKSGLIKATRTVPPILIAPEDAVAPGSKTPS
jgi:predicted site-specific integrase-resolvase